jgi:phage shock protein A
MLRSDWRETVDEIERGLQQCLASLERYESQFQAALVEPNSEPSSSVEQVRIVRPQVPGYSDVLATAGERVASVERLIDEQKNLWQQFHDAVREVRKPLSLS